MPAKPATSPRGIHVGIGGWTFAPWRGRFYPKGLRQADELAYAASRLTAIEINGTFHRTQTKERFVAWREAVPDGFVFAVKAHRIAAYSKPGPGQEQAVARFLGSGLAELGPKLGPILWQFPPTRRFDKAQAEAFLASLPARLGALTLRHAVEARHESFADLAWTDLLREHGASAVIVDAPEVTPQDEPTVGFVYCRLKRNAADAPEGYDGQALDSWATRIKAWSKKRACFVFCIAGDKERAPDAALALLQRLGKR